MDDLRLTNPDAIFFSDFNNLSLSDYPSGQSSYSTQGIIIQDCGFDVGFRSYMLSEPTDSLLSDSISAERRYVCPTELQGRRVDYAVRGQSINGSDSFHPHPTDVGNRIAPDTLRLTGSMYRQRPSNPSYPILGNSIPHYGSSTSNSPTDNHHIIGHLAYTTTNGGFSTGLRNDDTLSRPYRRGGSSNGSPSRYNRNANITFDTLEELRSNVVFMSRDREGCFLLERKLNRASREEIGVIVGEVKKNFHSIMIDSWGNALVQKILDLNFYAEDDITEILSALVGDLRSLLQICMDSHGTQGMQKLLEKLTRRDQILIAISPLREITWPLAKDQHGHHVIEACIKLFMGEDVVHILNEVTDHWLDIATDKSGCCLVQDCISFGSGKARDRLIDELIPNVAILSQDPYGNYVVQHMISSKISYVRGRAMMHLFGHLVSISMNKFGSHVVEKCIRYLCDGNHVTQIVKELMESNQFLNLLQNQYGNYVIQTALNCTRGPLRRLLVRRIMMYHQSLNSHPYGKRVLARIKRKTWEQSGDLRDDRCGN